MSQSTNPTRGPKELFELDRRYVFHPFTALDAHQRDGAPLVMTSGSGVYLQDSSGRRYIDAMAGLWCVNVGYGRRELADAMHRQTMELSYCHAFSSMASDKPALLAERLIGMAPVPMSKVFFGNSGSDANDTQVKLVWYYNNARGRPEKKKIIARQRGYHGVTVMSGGMTGLPGLHAGFDLPLPFVRHTTAAIMIGEYEPGLIHDMPAYIEHLAPAGVDYRHNQVNHDDNAHSHLAGSVIGPSETVPVVDGRLVPGTWQQIILIELDPHPRQREVVIQVVGK